MKNDKDKEAVLLTLDQLSQTMDVMRQVVRRLKRSIEAGENTSAGDTGNCHPQGQVRDDQASSRGGATLECRDESSLTLH